MLPGADAQSRDFAFGLELKEKLPRLFTGRIESLEEAKAAEAELIRLSPTSLRIGIPLNRLSEDVVHGAEHASVAQWLPEEPPLVPSASLAAWYAAEDVYLQSPTQAHLHDLLLLHTRLVNANLMLGLGAISAFQVQGAPRLARSGSQPHGVGAERGNSRRAGLRQLQPDLGGGRVGSRVGRPRP